MYFSYMKDSTPPSIITVSPQIRMEPTAATHAAGLLQAVNENREHLEAFLPWVPFMQTVTDFENYIAHCLQLHQQNEERSFVIFYEDKIVGRIGLHHINNRDKNASIGYWLCKSAEGKGIVGSCCKAIIQYGFEHLQLHRIEIRAAEQNLRSRAIPQKLGFSFEGTIRQAEYVNGQWYNLALYSILKEEWIKHQS